MRDGGRATHKYGHHESYLHSEDKGNGSGDDLRQHDDEDESGILQHSVTLQLTQRHAPINNKL